MDRLFPARPTDASLCWGLGYLEVSPTPRALCHVPEQFLRCGIARCHARGWGVLPSGRACTWPAMVFGWVVRVKLHPHECQGPRLPSRTLPMSFTHSSFDVTADRWKCLVEVTALFKCDESSLHNKICDFLKQKLKQKNNEHLA